MSFVPNDMAAQGSNRSNLICIRGPNGVVQLDPSDRSAVEQFAADYASSRVRVNLRQFEGMTDPARITALQCLRDLGRRIRIQVSYGRAQRAPLEDVTRLSASRIEDRPIHELDARIGVALAIAATFSDTATALQLCCNAIYARLHAERIPGFDRRQLLDRARRLRALAAAAEETVESLIRDVWPDAPVDDSMRVPPGWVFHETGISAPGGADEIAIPGRLLIVRLFDSVDDSRVHVEIAYDRNGRWNREIVGRERLASARYAVELAAFGVPVNTLNADHVVAYFVAFEVANRDVLPTQLVSRCMGWLRDNRSFLLGSRHVRPSASEAVDEVIFRGGTHGEEELAHAYSTQGDFAAWRAAIERVASFQRVYLALAAACATPLLRILDAPNFVVSFDGPTSSGKTSVLKIAASIYGSPEVGGSGFGSPVRSWNATRNFIELSAAVQTDLPIFLDDTMAASAQAMIATVIYEVVGGRGRGRGAGEGLRTTGSWRTTMLSTGEIPIGAIAQEGGARARVLQIWGSPFGEQSGSLGTLIGETLQAVRLHHGHFAPMLVQWLLDNPEVHDALRQLHQAWATHFVSRAGNDAVAGRYAQNCATLQVSALVLDRLLHWSFGQDLLDHLWPDLTRETAEADRAIEALRHVYSWAVGNSNRFQGSQHAGREQPTSGWAGVWRQASELDPSGQGVLLWFQDRLREVLRERDFSFDAVVRQWKDREWLVHNSDRRTLAHRFGGGAPLGMIAIRWDAIARLDSDDAGQPVPTRTG